MDQIARMFGLTRNNRLGFTLVELLVVIAIIGLRESHGIGSGRATLAIFLPFIAIVVFFMVVGISLLYKLSEFL